MRLDPSFKAQFISSRSSHEHDAINHITWPIRTLDQENEDVDALSVRHTQTWRIDTNPKPFIHKYQNPFFSINPTKATFYHQLFWKHPLLIKLTKIWFSHLPAAAISVDMATKYIAYFPAVFFLIFFIFESLPFSADAPQDLPSKAANAASCQNKPRQKNRQAVKITSAKSFTCHDLKCFILDFCALNKCHTYFGKINVCCTSCNNWHYQCQLIQTKITLKTVHAII